MVDRQGFAPFPYYRTIEALEAAQFGHRPVYIRVILAPGRFRPARELSLCGGDARCRYAPHDWRSRKTARSAGAGSLSQAATDMFSWCRREDSNPRPEVYKTPALPTELRRHEGDSTPRARFRLTAGCGRHRRRSVPVPDSGPARSVRAPVAPARPRSAHEGADTWCRPPRVHRTRP